VRWAFLLPDGASLQHLIHGAHETFGIDEHQLIKLATLRFVDLSPLQSLQVETDRGDRRFEFVRNSVDEAAVLLVAPNFADQKDRVEHQAGDDGAEKDDAKKDLQTFAPVEDDPAAAHGSGDRRKDDTEGQEERNRFAPAGDSHREIVAGRGKGVRCQPSGLKFAL
jgi:hypothetical protein